MIVDIVTYWGKCPTVHCYLPTDTTSWNPEKMTIVDLKFTCLKYCSKMEKFIRRQWDKPAGKGNFFIRTIICTYASARKGGLFKVVLWLPQECYDRYTHLRMCTHSCTHAHMHTDMHMCTVK